MKNFLILMLATLLSVSGYGQCCQYNSFTQGAAPSFYTYQDSVTNTGVDTFATALDPYRNGVGFQINVLKKSGNPAGAYIQLWGSKEASQSGAYYLIATDTIRNIATTQVFNHDIGGVSNFIASNGQITPTITSAGGNPGRWYMVTIQGVSSSAIYWKGISFIR